jgi:hypothetical protein
LAKLKESDILAKDSREAGNAPFVELHTMIRDAIKAGVFRGDLPVELVSGSLGALAEATMELMALHPSKANGYRTSGFQMFCSGITK